MSAELLPPMRCLYRLDAAKKEKNVHNACLLNYYYYLCDSFDEKLACATARCIAGRSAKASPLSFYKVAINE